MILFYRFLINVILILSPFIILIRLLKKSSIILLDEATSSLDADTEQKIQQALTVLTENKTTLVIAHRLSTILNSDQIYVIDSGKVIANGNHAHLLKNSSVYKNFYDKQITKN